MEIRHRPRRKNPWYVAEQKAMRIWNDELAVKYASDIRQGHVDFDPAIGNFEVFALEEDYERLRQLRAECRIELGAV